MREDLLLGAALALRLQVGVEPGAGGGISSQPRFFITALRLRRPRALELELFHLADLREERHERQTDEATVAGDDRLHVHSRALGEHGDHRLLGRREIAHHGNDARHERPLGLVGDEGVLAVEERDLRRLHHIRSRVALRRLDQEVGLDVAEDREAEVGGRCGRVGQAGERRHGGTAEAVLTKRNREETGSLLGRRLARRRAAAALAAAAEATATTTAEATGGCATRSHGHARHAGQVEADRLAAASGSGLDT